MAFGAVGRLGQGRCWKIGDLSNHVTREIYPDRISFFYEVNLPLAGPAFDLFFTAYGKRHLVETLEPNQIRTAILLREPRSETALMLANARRKVRAAPCVDRAILSVGHDISGNQIKPCHAGNVHGLCVASISQHLTVFVIAGLSPSSALPSPSGQPITLTYREDRESLSLSFQMARSRGGPHGQAVGSANRIAASVEANHSSQTSDLAPRESADAARSA